jgi:hypothetical protein
MTRAHQEAAMMGGDPDRVARTEADRIAAAEGTRDEEAVEDTEADGEKVVFFGFTGEGCIALAFGVISKVDGMD